MKKYIFSFFLLAVSVFCFSNTYGQDDDSSVKQELYVTFINSTDTEAHLNISEEKAKSPYYTYLTINEINLASGQTESIPFLLTLNNDQKITLAIFTTGGEGYGQTGSTIEVDITKSNVFTIELTESWIYPGDGFWYIDPFRVIKARMLK